MSPGALRRSLARARRDVRWQSTLREWLPPVDRREFWAVQALVLIIAATHSWLEYQRLLDEHSPIYLFPTTLYLIPIVYAAVNFGLRGSLLTALWSAALVLPNVLLWHQGLERVGEIVQVGWITVAAVFVGSRVDRERVARLEAESREAALRASEARYRVIVDNVEEPIFLLDDEPRIIEANAAAAELMATDPARLRGRTLAGPVGDRIAQALTERGTGDEGQTIMRLGVPARWFELMAVDLDRRSGTRRMQVLLRDVTASYERERGLEGITRQTLAAREEEQRRIAREIHDGPLQSLVQLWRTLDGLAQETSGADGTPLLEARETAESVADELRRFSRDLRPSVLDDLGIVAAIRTEVEAFTDRTGISAQVRTTGPLRRIDTDIELALLRIAQEALRNVEHHAGATDVEVLLAFLEHRVHMTISDDGVGLPSMPPASELLARSHLGLIGMQERARLVDGRLRLRPSASGGLSVEVDVPIVPTASILAGADGSDDPSAQRATAAGRWMRRPS